MPILDEGKRREYQKSYHLKTWYRRKIRHGVLKRKRERDLSNWLANYKSGLACEMCGENYVGCLDFHHKTSNKKVDAVSNLVAKGYGKNKILLEIGKCIVLCKNCHVKTHDKFKFSHPKIIL